MLSFREKMRLSKDQKKQLELISICPKKLRKDLLKKLPNSCIKTICECVLNALKGNIPLSEHQQRKLASHKKVLRILAFKKIPIIKKRKLIVQRGGGFLSFLIPAAITAISTLINGIRS